jgi:hypothetical protein
MQFTILNSRLKFDGIGKKGRRVSLDESLFMEIIRAAITSPKVLDEEFYLSRSPDVMEAIKNGSIKSAHEHFAGTGYFEGRLPRPIFVDQAYYIKANPDVDRALKSGQIASAQEHFELVGYREGRMPYDGFSVF